MSTKAPQVKRRPSHFVRRRRPGALQDSFTGPICSEAQAEREAAAWISIGWAAERVEATPEVWREVRAWQRARRRERQGQHS